MKKGILIFCGLLLAQSVSAQVFFSDDFNSAGTTPTGWTITDEDGDGQNWYKANFSGYFAENGSGSAISRSWTNTTGALSPNNFMTRQIDLTSAPASGLTLTFRSGTIEAGFPAEHYAVYVTTSADPGVIAASTPIFEETLPSDGMFPHSVSMAAYAGQNVYVTFRHFDCYDQNTLIIDDIEVKSVAANDAALVALALPKYVMQNSTNSVGIDVQNVGSSAITSITINLAVDGVNFPQTFSTNIAPGATTTLTHASAITMWDIEQNLVDVTIQQVNNVVDADPSNNSASTSITSVGYAAPKTVLIEEGTGTWCGWCPRGAVAMEYMYNTYPTGFLGVAVHNGDPMAVAAYDNGADLSGYPGCNVDRVLLDQGVSTSAFQSYYNARKDLIVPAQVGLTESAVGSDITIVASAVFHSNFSSADFRLGVIMVEDDVTGTSSGYNQTNYYAGGSNGAMGGYESLPDPVPAAQMVYDHVGRALLGGYDGQAGSVPTTLSNGQVVSYTFNYTVPGTSDIANMHPIAVLIDNTTGEIVNAGNTAVDPSASIEAIQSIKSLNIYPNPASDYFTVEIDAEKGNYVVTLTDLAGKVVSTNSVSNASGTSTVAINVANLKAGNYLVAVANGSASYTKMVTIK